MEPVSIWSWIELGLKGVTPNYRPLRLCSERKLQKILTSGIQMMIIKMFTATALLLAAGALQAATPVKDAALERYALRAMVHCPGSTVQLLTNDGAAPAGFNSYRLQHRSSDQRCGRNTHLLTSKSSDTYIVGDTFSIPAGKESLDKRVAALTGGLLKRSVTAKVSPTASKDGLRLATITSKLADGTPFEYHGWVDKSGKYFIVGRLGSKNVDPGESLLAALKASAGATRGNSMGRIRIIEISDFQCPTCKLAHDTIEPLVRRNLNKISYTRLDLPLFESHDWAVKAAVAARAIQKVAPDKYWQFVDYTFGNQQVLSKSSIDVMVRDFAEDFGIDWKKLGPIYESAAAKKEVLAQVSRSFDSGIFATPTFIVNGQVIFFGDEGSYLRSYIEGLLSGRPVR